MSTMRKCGAALPPGFDGRQVFSQIITTCAALEKNVTRFLLEDAAVVALQQDGRDPWLVIMSRMVLWRMPRSEKDGCKRATRSVLPDGGPPWTADRFLDAHRFWVADRTAEAQADILVKAVRRAAGTPVDFEAVADKVLFDTKDNAADEVACGRALKATFKNMIDLTDTTHTMQLIMKHAVSGEPEVTLVQEVMLTNKKPHKSVSSLLRDSSACRAAFANEQENEVKAVLRHLSWAPQRMSSRHKPYARASLRPGALFAFLADRAENASEGSDKKAALHNLEKLAPFKRMVLAGMLADLTWEHRKAVMWSDVRDPDPSEIVEQLDGFMHRLRVLFGEGLIMGSAMTGTFTAQIVEFYKEPKILKAHPTPLPVLVKRVE